MTPRSGPGGPGSGPRGPKTAPRAPQESPKSRPEAVSERPGWPSGAHLAPKRPPEASRKPFGPPRGWILASLGLHFRSFRHILRSLPGSKRKRKHKRRHERKRKSKRKRKSQKPRTESRQAARPQGLKGPAGCAEHPKKSTNKWDLNLRKNKWKSGPQVKNDEK